MTGKETKLVCPCGGGLVEYRPTEQMVLETTKPRYARTKRLQKKLHKRWREKQQPLLMQRLMIDALSPSQFKCKSCGKVHGYYEALARSCFKIEPMSGQPIGVIQSWDRS